MENPIIKNEKISNEYNEAVKATYEKVKIHELINFNKEPANPVKVSIIVPVCNVEQYLRECLDSCINQTLRDIEIICVNDGSTDGSLDILKEYAENDERVKIIDKDNAGYGHAMNIGMDMAKGEYIGIVESDDFVDLHMYEDLYNIAVEKTVKIVKSDFYRFVWEEGELKKYFNPCAKPKNNYNVIIDPHKNLEVFRFIMNTWCGIYKRDFIINNMIRHNETPGASYQDNGFYFQTMCKTDSVYYVNRAYYYNRRDNPNSSVYSNSKLYCMRDEYAFINNIIFDKYENNIFRKIFYLKKFSNYRFTYYRVNNDGKKEYLETFYNEFSKDIQSEWWDWDIFNDIEKEELKFILKSPDEFYESTKSGIIRISVIIPFYNESAHISECLDSVQSQNLKDIEIICIDDGSTDSSVEIVESHMSSDSRIILLKQENKGSGSARNYGLSVANGEFVCFMDADDFYPANNVLSNLYISAKNNNVNICGGSFSQIDNKSKKVSVNYEGELAKYVFTRNEIVDFSNYQFIYGYHRFIYKRQMLKDAGIKFPDYLRFQDPPFMLRAMIEAKKFYSVNQIVYRYRKEPNKLIWNKEKVHGLLCGIDEVLCVSDSNNLGLLHYSAILKVNKDFLNVIMEFITPDNLEILMLLYNINNHINAALINKEYPDYDMTDFIIKPIYRVTSSYKQLTAKSAELAALKCMKEDLEKKVAFLEKENSSLKKQFESNSVGVQLVVNSELQKALINQYDHSNRQTEKYVKLIEDYKKQNDELNYIITETRKSLTYKIGRLITWLPRKIISIIRA